MTAPDPFAAPPLGQSPLLAGALRRLGQQAQFVEPVDGLRMLVIGRRVPGLGRVTSTLRGPLIAPGVPPGIVVAALRRAGPRLIEAEVPLPRAGYVPLMTPAHVAEWHLAPPGVMRAGMGQKWRNALVQAEGAGLTLRCLPCAGAPMLHLLAAENAQRAARRYRALPLALVPALTASDPAAVRLWQAEQGGLPIARMLILRHGQAATYHIGWTSDAGRAANAHHLMLWRIALWLADRGVRRLDLGTIDTEHAPGLARFKLGCGAQARALGGSWLRLPLAGGIAGWKRGTVTAKGDQPA